MTNPKPSYPPDFATDHNIQASTTANGNNQYDVIDVGGALRQDGYDYDDTPTYEDHNFLFKVNGLWHRWSEEIFDYITHNMAVVTSSDYSLEALALKLISDSDQNNADLQDKAPQDRSLYAGNLIKAQATVLLKYDGSNWVIEFEDSYNIDESASGVTETGTGTIDLVFDTVDTWTPTGAVFSISGRAGFSPPIWKSRMASIDATDVELEAYWADDYNSTDGDQFEYKSFNGISSPATDTFAKLTVHCI